MGFIYLIWTTKYKLQNMNVYKVGRTEQKELLKRLKGYGKLGEDYFILYYTKCNLDSQIIEKQIIDEFKEHFLLYQGNEWFMGDSTEMINIIKNKNKNEIVKTDTKEEIKEISKELEEIHKDVQQSDIKFLYHIVRYNILEETIDDEEGYSEEAPRKHLRLNFNYGIDGEREDEILKIFTNMFKWLEELNYFDSIKTAYFEKVIIEFTSSKGGIYLVIRLKHSGCDDGNLGGYIYDSEGGIGTNEIISTIVEIIAQLNYKIKNKLNYKDDFLSEHCYIEQISDKDFLTVQHNVIYNVTNFYRSSKTD